LNGGIDVLRTEDAAKKCSLCSCKPNTIEAQQSKIYVCTLNRQVKARTEHGQAGAGTKGGAAGGAGPSVGEKRTSSS